MPGEIPIDFMYRNNRGFFVEPYVSNLAGWSEKMYPQIETAYPRIGSFSKEGIRLAESMISGEWGDPDWDYQVMRKCHAAWLEMKKVWDQGPEKPKVNAPRSKCAYPSLEKPPPYLAPSAPPDNARCIKSNTATVAQRQVDDMAMKNTSMVWHRTGNGISLRPLKVTDMDAICKALPPPSNPVKFISVLKAHTRYAHLTGADFRAILLRVLDNDITEEALLHGCPALDYKNDAPEGSATGVSPHIFPWEDAKLLDLFYEQLRGFLDKLANKKQDMSFVVNTKQKQKETPSEFFSRFKAAWVEESKLPLNNDLKALFTNTYLNNMLPRQSQLIRITTPNLFDMDIAALGKRVRELDASGGFAVKSESAMFTEQFSAAPQAQPSANKANRKPRSDIVCYRCGRRGHVQRDCRFKEVKQHRPFQQRPVQRSQSQPVAQKHAGNSYPVAWRNNSQ
ncbi:MAG: C2HC-type zinc finger protein [Plesiomonas sp.]